MTFNLRTQGRQNRTQASTMPKNFHPLLALVAFATNNELARYIEYLKEEKKLLRARIPSQQGVVCKLRASGAVQVIRFVEMLDL